MTPHSRAEGRGPRPAMGHQEVTKFSRRRRSCCSRGTQLALLALVMTALWAGLLTLLLLWREDTPNPQDPHLMFPPGPPLSDPGEPNFPDLPTLGHFPPQTSISSWQVGCGWMETPDIYPFSPLLSLIHPLSHATDWENARNLKQLEETAAQNVSQVSKDLETHKGDQMAQKSQAAQIMQDMERIQAEQKRMESQESALSWNLDGLRADLSDLKSRGLNEMRQALDSLGRLQEEVGKLWIELRASNAQTSGETLPPTLPVVPTAPAIALSTVPNTASTLVPTTTSTTASTTMPSTTATTTATTTVPTTAAPLSLSSTPGSVCNTCPEAWIYFHKKCYYFGEGSKKWLEARYTCENLHGRLVSIHSPEEQDFLTKRANWRGSWIGLRDLDIEGEFIWMDNQPLDYSNWQPGEPNDAGLGENCVMMLSSGKWNDAFCGSKLHGWVCDRLATC